MLPRVVARDIVHAPQDGRFELYWDLVVCFVTRGDPFPNEERASKSTLHEVREVSPFLEWVKAHCHAGSEYVALMGDKSDSRGRSLRHWQVSTNEALFDVASLDPPAVRRLQPLVRLTTESGHSG